MFSNLNDWADESISEEHLDKENIVKNLDKREDEQQKKILFKLN